jgi:uncharacterized membrane protein YvbJ
MSKIIVCPSCGGHYKEKLVRCPYCGTATLEAEEKEYMGKLEDIRTDLEDYGEKAPKQINKSIVKTILIAIIVVIILAACIILPLWMSIDAKNKKVQKEKEEFLKNQGITTGMLEVTTYDM